MVKEFSNGYEWLSNFFPVEITLDGTVYQSVEHAFMSAKSDSEEWKKFCSDPNVKAGYVKKKSREVKLIDGWDSVKMGIMKECLTQKFSKNPFRAKLIETGDVYIQEGNWWNDKIWGVCLKTGEGENRLGRLIMDIRAGLIS
jgi:ribA/ribD-fused uncharacterized protein